MDLTNTQRNLLTKLLHKEIEEYEDEIIRTRYQPHAKKLLLEQLELKEILGLISS